MKIKLFLIYLLQVSFFWSQTDTTKYSWPTPNFNSSRGLTATFGEFRNTGSSDHFHNAVDIGEPDGNPVYPCIDGVVHYLSDNGYDSYINVISIVNGKKKHITYYHVVPNPSLSIGQNVKAGQSLIGTIYVGAAHVHLIEYQLMDQSSGSYGTSMNPVRPKGGLTPYYDDQAPEIITSSLQFYKDNSFIEIPGNQLNGKVDIKIEVREKNGTSPSQLNNGTYILGYRVLSEDGNTTIYEPANNGNKYRFYYKPSKSYVHNVFIKGIATLSKPVYWLTNGSGEVSINQTLSVGNNYLDTDILDAGNYLLEIFSEDTRENRTSKQFPFSVIKLPPELNTVVLINDSIKISWEAYNLNRLAGYRIYYSNLYENNWKLATDETMLKKDDTNISFISSNDFLQPTNGNLLQYYITAVDSSGNESDKSDTYSTVFHDKSALKLLIVDGFDRYGGTGSWSEPNHNFNIIYSKAIQRALWYFNISSASNEAVINEEVNLNDYDMVIWFLGDESIEENTLIGNEQGKLARYLESGGKLLITGEDIGKDLDTKHSFNDFTDQLFYHEYLMSNFIHDGLEILYEVNGAEETIFEGLNIHFGDTYPVESPDDIEPINGAIPIFNYTYERDSTYRKGGIAYTGTFGDSANIGSFVYLSFPFETIGDSEKRAELMQKIQRYLGFNIVGVETEETFILSNYELLQNYPNPFNPSTTIQYKISSNSVILNPIHQEKNHQDFSLQSSITGAPQNDNVKLIVYDILGREVAVLVNEQQKPGNYQVTFDASKLSSGVYYYQLRTNNFIQTKKMTLIK